MMEYRSVKDHQDQLLAEARARHEVKAAKAAGRNGRSAPRERLGFIGRLFASRTPAQQLWVSHGSRFQRRRRRLPTLVEVERALIGKLSDDVCRRARRLARQRAIDRFARSHTLWYESLFDSRLLRSLPEDYFKRSAASVARSWASQFPYYRDASRDRDVERLEPVANDFLQILAEEERRLAVC